MLEPMGVTLLEEQVYELLVSRGRMSLTEVVAAGDGAPQLLRDALDSLVAKGLVRPSTGDDAGFVVTPPEQAFEVLITRRLNDLHAVRARAAEVAARVRRTTQASDPSQLVEVVSGEGSVRQLLFQAFQSARGEILAFDRPPYVTDLTEAAIEQDQQLATHGYRLRTVFDKSLLEDPGHVRRILHGLGHGEEGRVGSVALKIVIIDREWAILPLRYGDAQPAEESAVIVRQSILLDSLIALFESVWQQSVEIKLVAGDLELSGTSENELRQMAQLLAAGMTDIAIGRLLGISPRTVSRRIKDLLDEFKVDSRFQAGIKARQRGWV